MSGPSDSPSDSNKGPSKLQQALVQSPYNLPKAAPPGPARPSQTKTQPIPEQPKEESSRPGSGPQTVFETEKQPRIDEAADQLTAVEIPQPLDTIQSPKQQPAQQELKSTESKQQDVVQTLVDPNPRAKVTAKEVAPDEVEGEDKDDDLDKDPGIVSDRYQPHQSMDNAFKPIAYDDMKYLQSPACAPKTGSSNETQQTISSHAMLNDISKIAQRADILSRRAITASHINLKPIPCQEEGKEEDDEFEVTSTFMHNSNLAHDGVTEPPLVPGLGREADEEKMDEKRATYKPPMAAAPRRSSEPPRSSRRGSLFANGFVSKRKPSLNVPPYKPPTTQGRKPSNAGQRRFTLFAIPSQTQRSSLSVRGGLGTNASGLSTTINSDQAIISSSSSSSSDEDEEVVKTAQKQKAAPSLVENEDTGTSDEQPSASAAPGKLKPIEKKEGSGGGFSIKQVVNLKKWQIRATGIKDPSNLKEFSKSELHYQLLRQNMDNVVTELPLPLKITVFQSAFPIIKDTVKEYQHSLGKSHHLSKEAHEHLMELANLGDLLENM